MMYLVSPPADYLASYFRKIDLGFFNLQRWVFFGRAQQKGSCSFQCLVPPLRLWNVSWTSPRRSWTMLVTRAEKSPKISMLVSKSQAILHGICKKIRTKYRISCVLGMSEAYQSWVQRFFLRTWVTILLQWICCFLAVCGVTRLQVFRDWIHFFWPPSRTLLSGQAGDPLNQSLDTFPWHVFPAGCHVG